MAEEAAPAAAASKARRCRWLVERLVLVADDEPDQVEFLATVFADHGAKVVPAASNGDEALAVART